MRYNYVMIIVKLVFLSFTIQCKFHPQLFLFFKTTLLSFTKNPTVLENVIMCISSIFLEEVGKSKF